MNPASAPVPHLAGHRDGSQPESVRSRLGPAPGATRGGSGPAGAAPGDVETMTHSTGNVGLGGNGHPDITALNSNRCGSMPVEPKDMQDA